MRLCAQAYFCRPLRIATTLFRYGEHFQHARQRILLALPLDGHLFLCRFSIDAVLSEFHYGIPKVIFCSQH